jgi:hypothetical protein
MNINNHIATLINLKPFQVPGTGISPDYYVQEADEGRMAEGGEWVIVCAEPAVMGRIRIPGPCLPIPDYQRSTLAALSAVTRLRAWADIEVHMYLIATRQRYYCRVEGGPFVYDREVAVGEGDTLESAICDALVQMRRKYE